MVDVRPLQESTPFRRLWLGSTLSAVGTQMTTFAVALQVYLLTHSSAAVGATGLVAALPAVCFGLLGGAVIDAVDRRILVLATSSALACVSSAFAVQAFLGLHRLWLLYLLVGIESLIGSINAPARRTFLPRLLPPHRLTAANALTMLTMHTSLLLGPVFAGLLAAAGGLKLCYLVDAVSFSGALYGVARLPAMRPQGDRPNRSVQSVIDGLRFLRHNPVVGAALLADVSATTLAMPIALFPAINSARFGGSPRTLGLFTMALAVGGLMGSGLSGPVGRVARPGRGMLAAGAVWGSALAGFGLAHGLAVTLGCLAVAGAADVTSVVFRATIVQLATPDELRGRVGATDYIVGAAMPQVGNFRAGLVATWTTPGTAAVSGGLAATAGAALLAVLFPAFVRFRLDRGSPQLRAWAPPA